MAKLDDIRNQQPQHRFTSGQKRNSDGILWDAVFHQDRLMAYVDGEKLAEFFAMRLVILSFCSTW